MQQYNRYYLLDKLMGNQYKIFLKLAFEYSDFFSVSTFKTVRKKDLRESYFDFMNKIQPFKIDVYTFKQLPQHYERGQNINTYKLNDFTKKIILNTVANGIYDWLIPCLPEDLSFFKGKKVWFNSISHAKISEIITCDEKLLKQLEVFNLTLRH